MKIIAPKASNDGAGASSFGFETLAAEAEKISGTDTGTDNDAASPGQPGKLTNAKVLTAALTVARDVFFTVTKFESVPKNLGPKEIEVLSSSWALVLDKYGIELDAWAGEYAAELAALAVTVPLGMAVVMGVRHDMAARDMAESDKVDAKNHYEPDSEDLVF